MSRIVKTTGLKYAMGNDRKKLLTEHSDAATAKAMFFITMHEIRQDGCNTYTT
jgi:hypothetical protein